MDKKTKNSILEAMAWLLVIGGIALVVFLSLLFFPRFQYKFCYKEYVKTHQGTSNFLEGNANEHCDEYFD